MSCNNRPIGSFDVIVDDLAGAFSRLSLYDHRDIGRPELPDDILYNLFLSMKTSDAPSSVRTTVKLSHVCTRWRDVIVHAPLLWTYVTVYWTPRKRDHSEVIKSFLCRSKRLSLSFHLFISCCMACTEPRIRQLAMLLHPHAHRIHTVKVKTTFEMHSHIPISNILPARMPLLRRLHIALPDSRRCIISVKEPRSHKEIAHFRQCLVPPISDTHFLDWSIRSSHLTTISLKYCDMSPRQLLPILIMTQSTLLHLEIYDDWPPHPIGFTANPVVTLPNLISLSLGYLNPVPLWALVHRLILPKLRSLSVHDFGECPEPTTPTCRPQKHPTISNDAFDLLVAMCPFTTVTHLTLRGVSCPDTTFEDMMEPMRYLFEGLESLAIIRCDTEFVDGLFEVTLDSDLSELNGLTELLVTINDYSFFMEYLRLRAARGLPRFKILAVNPRMALLRHFYRDYSDSIYVRGHKLQELRSTP
ncbi:hypothetical protein Hypma_010912 [Hypsizygus marmoreus]|uniref:Uncharacterized protein n=1 Tax=Hypsizygus marmoreus TaxID=39966 RepID=A0A369JRE9_HYPMA|nr:hypothetical protein Hypma_010912 [Hypsizygus marmoreus]